MKLRHAFLIALGIATPLWLRQYRFEVLVSRGLRQHGDEVSDALDRQAKELGGILDRWAKAFNAGASAIGGASRVLQHPGYARRQQ